MSRKNTSSLGNYLAIAFVPISLLYLLVGYNQGINLYDEGLISYGAHTLLKGGMLYRDFWSGYGPAQFYLIAGIFKIFGEFALLARLTTLIAMWATCGMIYLVARRLGPPSLALPVWALAVIASVGYVPGLPPPMPMILLTSLLCGLCLLNYLSSRRTSRLVLSGLLVGIVTLFRHDFGAYNAFAGTVVLTVLAMKCGVPAAESISRRLASFVRMLFCYYLSAGVLVLPVFLYFAAKDSVADLKFVWVTLPLKLYAKFFRLPYPTPPNPLHSHESLKVLVKMTLDVMPFWLPILIIGLTAVVLVLRLRRTGSWADQLPALFFLMFSLGAMNYARIRADYPHGLPAVLMACLLLPVVLSEIPRTRISLRVLAVIACLCLIYHPITRKMDMARIAMSAPEYVMQLPRAKGLHVSAKWSDYEKAVRYIQANTTPDERIFVGCNRHDMLRTNDAMFYFLSERESATRYVELHRAVASTAPCQQRIVGGIEQYHVRYIVLRDDFRREPNLSSRSSGVFVLDNFIKANFAPVVRFGDDVIWKRKHTPA